MREGIVDWERIVDVPTDELEVPTRAAPFFATL